MAVACSEGGGAEVNGLRKRVAVARWFLGQQQSEREHGGENLLSVVRASTGPKILEHGT
jgi:hypothetical protein